MKSAKPQPKAKSNSSTKVNSAVSINISKTAASKLQEIARQAKMEGKYVRVFAAHGCCGMQYGMDFDDTPGKNDTVFEQSGVKILVENSMIELLRDAKIEYVKTEHSEGFRIDNPNEQKSECGTGCHC
ncbi:MAG: iron-sulfur cluster assembly accessory protein [archaeon]